MLRFAEEAVSSQFPHKTFSQGDWILCWWSSWYCPRVERQIGKIISFLFFPVFLKIIFAPNCMIERLNLTELSIHLAQDIQTLNHGVLKSFKIKVLLLKPTVQVAENLGCDLCVSRDGWGTGNPLGRSAACKHCHSPVALRFPSAVGLHTTLP